MSTKNQSFKWGKLNFSEMSKEAPVNYLKLSWYHTKLAVGNLLAWMFFGLRWLFKNYPNITWAIICSVIIIISVLNIMSERANRDKANADAAALCDSIDHINMNRVTYTTFDTGKVVNPIKIGNGGSED